MEQGQKLGDPVITEMSRREGTEARTTKVVVEEVQSGWTQDMLCGLQADGVKDDASFILSNLTGRRAV